MRLQLEGKSNGVMGGGGLCDEEEPSLDFGVIRSGVLRGLANVVQKHTQFHNLVFKILRLTRKKDVNLDESITLKRN